MPKSVPPHFWERIKLHVQDPAIPEKYQKLFKQFYEGYLAALHAHGMSTEHSEGLFISFAQMVKDQCIEPFPFQPYHVKIREPIDYYAFGLDFIRPLIEKEKSSLRGHEHLEQIVSSLEKGENAIFLANHQIEADPQAISVMLEDSYPQLGENLIFIAGERVITDPLAAPFSMGRNLLCIYSKRYIDHPPELKAAKQLHNKRTMQLMSELLGEGGKAIYVAPSGGRDRPNAEGIVEVADFDPQSIEMLNLMAERAGHPTHFYPLTLKTYDLLPPPETIQVELGEARVTNRGGIHVAFGPRISMDSFPGSEIENKHERRQARASYICNLVKQEYDRFS